MKEINFDRSKIFYPYIVNYIVSLHGLLETVSRGFYSKVRLLKDKGLSLKDIEIKQEVIEEKQKDFIFKIFSEDLKPTIILGDFSLKSEQRGTKLEISIDEIAEDLIANFGYLLPHQTKMIGSLLVTCYEISKNKYLEKNELWNFFYHVRNAAAHGGFFNIINHGRFPAKWGNLEITQEMNGCPLFKDGNGLGFLSPGDPVYLLYDLEQIL